MLTDPTFEDIPDVRHAFFTRAGGVSEGIYGSLNCGFGSGDDAERVCENRKRALAVLELDDASLVTACQSHTAEAIRVDEIWLPEDAPIADGMVTTSPGIALGILTADCAPVIFVDRDSRVIGAVHAGWRGARAGIIENTLDLMVDAGATASRIDASIGPCIGPRSYEVSNDFRAAFLSDNSVNEKFFFPAVRCGHAMFDLPGYVAHRLAAWGVRRSCNIAGDTYAEADQFFSYRRSILNGEVDYGRGLSVVALLD